MSRRAALPGANELFRATSAAAALAESPASVDPAAGNQVGESDAAAPVALAAGRPVKPRSTREPSGRERHAEKITVYLSADELVHLDEAKSALYRDHGLKVDRGRIVREAVAVVVGDLAAKGEASILTRRLRER